MKKISIFLILLSLLLSSVSCKGDGSSTVDIGAAAENILETVKFSEELILLESDMAKSLLLFDESDEIDIAMYVGSGASADQIIVATGDDFDRLVDKIKEYLETQKEMYSWYMIDEAAKIGNAVLKTKDPYIAVCITDDTEGAGRAIEKILK